MHNFGFINHTKEKTCLSMCAIFSGFKCLMKSFEILSSVSNYIWKAWIDCNIIAHGKSTRSNLSVEKQFLEGRVSNELQKATFWDLDHVICEKLQFVESSR